MEENIAVELVQLADFEEDRVRWRLWRMTMWRRTMLRRMMLKRFCRW
jgi:hypothetical protein